MSLLEGFGGPWDPGGEELGGTHREDGVGRTLRNLGGEGFSRALGLTHGEGKGDTE